mmetsp:Transcript_84119/g.216540  ORF Transcript_84119/g.216540 Transcript_84119/m.216540 type:complete len:214 (-) Transcript_84119:176-817(-)
MARMPSNTTSPRSRHSAPIWPKQPAPASSTFASVQELLGLNERAPSPHGNEAWRQGQQKGHAPAPLLHGLGAKVVLAKPGDGARQEKGDAASDAHQRGAEAQGTLRRTLGAVRGDAADLAAGAGALHEAAEKQQHHAKVAGDFAAAEAAGQQALAHRRYEHAKHGDQQCAAPPTSVCDPCEEGAADRPGHERDAEASPGGQLRAGEEVGRHGL